MKHHIKNILLFLLILYLINKFIKRPISDIGTESGGGLAQLTSTSNLLVTDDQGNLSTYNPSKDSFVTNDLTVSTTDTHFKSNSSGTTSNKLTVNGDLTVNSGSITSTGSITTNAGINATTDIRTNGNISAKGTLSAQNGLYVNADAATATGTSYLKTSRNFLGNWPTSELTTDGVLHVKNPNGTNTHFGYADNNNYIRGATTYITGNTNIDGNINIKDNLTVQNRNILSELNTLNAFMNKLTTTGFGVQNTANNTCLRNSTNAIFEGCSTSNGYQNMKIL